MLGEGDWKNTYEWCIYLFSFSHENTNLAHILFLGALQNNFGLRGCGLKMSLIELPKTFAVVVLGFPRGGEKSPTGAGGR